MVHGEHIGMGLGVGGVVEPILDGKMHFKCLCILHFWNSAKVSTRSKEYL